MRARGHRSRSRGASIWRARAIAGGEGGCDFYAAVFDGCTAAGVDAAGFDGMSEPDVVSVMATQLVRRVEEQVASAVRLMTVLPVMRDRS